MAKDGVPAPSQKPSDSSPGGLDEIPLRTQRAFDACVSRFTEMLIAKVMCKTHERHSQTPTDADVHEAFRELTHQDTPSKLARIIGDATMIFGAFLMPYCTISWVFCPVGLLICALGLYIREFSRK
jgi:hypothetical protein